MTVGVKNYCYPSRIHWGMGLFWTFILTLLRWLCSWSSMKRPLARFTINYKTSTQLANFKKLETDEAAVILKVRIWRVNSHFPKRELPLVFLTDRTTSDGENEAETASEGKLEQWGLVVPLWFRIFIHSHELMCHKDDFLEYYSRMINRLVQLVELVDFRGENAFKVVQVRKTVDTMTSWP